MNKKKNGFTLIEILAVVVIISLISILVIPKIVNSLRNKKSDIDSTTSNMIITAAKLYVSDHASKFDKDNGNIYCLPITTLTKNEYLESPVRNVTDDKDITNIISVKISYDEGFKYEVVNKKDCKINITDEKITYKTYSKGDAVTYNGMNFYVIADSDEKTDYVSLLKESPLTVDEVNKYGRGHVNMYINPNSTSYQTAYNSNGFGGIAYYTSETCGYDASGNVLSSGCTTDYESSEIKYIVDSWSEDKLNALDLKEDSLGYKTRLITFEDLTTNLGYIRQDETTYMNIDAENTPSWLYDSNYWYWTMSSYDDSDYLVWSINASGVVYNNDISNYNSGVVRPVINLYKSAIQ